MNRSGTSPQVIAMNLRLLGAMAGAIALFGSGCQSASNPHHAPAGRESVREPRSPARAADDEALLRDLPANLRDAARFDSTAEKDHQSLARRRATSPAQEAGPVRSEANRKLREIRSWIHLMESSDAALSRAISSATAYPSPHLGTWLNQRNQVRSRLASLRMHQSWFKTLAS